jgi:hypothetical protein
LYLLKIEKIIFPVIKSTLMNSQQAQVVNPLTPTVLRTASGEERRRGPGLAIRARVVNPLQARILRARANMGGAFAGLGDLAPEPEVRGVENVISTMEDAKTSPPDGAGLVGRISADVADPAGAEKKEGTTQTVIPKNLSVEELENMSRKELYKMAQDMDIPKRSKMKKRELVTAITKMYQSGWKPPQEVPAEPRVVAPQGDKPPPPELRMARDDMTDDERKALEAENQEKTRQYELVLANWEAQHQLLVNELKIRKQLDAKGITKFETQSNIIASLDRAQAPQEVAEDVKEEKAEKLKEVVHELALEPQIGVAQNPAVAPSVPLELARNPQGITYERKYQEVNEKTSADIHRGSVVLRDIENKKYKPTLKEVAKYQKTPLKKGLTPLGSIIQKSFKRMSILDRRLRGFDQGIYIPNTESNTVSAYKTNVLARPTRFGYGILSAPVGGSYVDEDALNNDFTDGLRIS